MFAVAGLLVALLLSGGKTGFGRPVPLTRVHVFTQVGTHARSHGYTCSLTWAHMFTHTGTHAHSRGHKKSPFPM